MFLARGTAIVESAQQLRTAVPGAVEHADALSAFADLSFASVALVAEFLLPGAFGCRRTGDVLPCIKVDKLLHKRPARQGQRALPTVQQVGRSSRRFCVRLQWTNTQLPDVAK